MSGYIGLNRTGFGPFDDSLSLIEEAGDSYHHTSEWLDEGWNGEKPYIDRINESIEFAANSYSDLIDALTALKAENEVLRKDAERWRKIEQQWSSAEIRNNLDGSFKSMTITFEAPQLSDELNMDELRSDAERWRMLSALMFLGNVECTQDADGGYRIELDPAENMLGVSWEGNSPEEAIDAAMAKGEQG